MTRPTSHVALVTGASRAIGRAVARRLHEHGVTVVAGMRQLPAGSADDGAIVELSPGLLAVELDVASPAHSCGWGRPRWPGACC
jgi:NAD(P)-dependent dehydrogenase (short-subunit alcohol dehydrogenase family)